MATLLDSIDEMIDLVAKRTQSRTSKFQKPLSEQTVMRIIELQYGMHMATRNSDPQDPEIGEPTEEELAAYLESLGDDNVEQMVLPFEQAQEDDPDTIDEAPTTDED